MRPDAVSGDAWSHEDNDRFLEMLLVEGMSEVRMALALRRKERAVHEHIGHLYYANQDWVKNYRPTTIRKDRRGQRMTGGERGLIKWHCKKSVPVEVTARILMRSVAEVDPRAKSDPCAPPPPKEVETSFKVDRLWAYRYLFHVSKKRVIPDDVYDRTKEEAIDSEKGGEVLARPPGKRVVDYPPHIRDLALYLYVKKGCPV